MSKSNNRQSNNVLRLVFIALFVALISVCSFICVPFPIPFTLQTFAIFLMLQLLSPLDSALALLSYLLLGIIGLPVFAGGKSGLGTLLGPTGGFLFGFLIGTLVYGLILCAKKKSTLRRLSGLAAFLIVTDLSGVLWYKFMYAGDAGLLVVMSTCVLPFIIPDIAKLFLSFYLSDRLKKHMPL